jgi:uncharacterized membrane protein YdfJ with MMPL/SSD domain
MFARIALAAALALAGIAGVAAPQAQAGWVSGHFRSNGTYVAPYMRSAPDGNPYNNYSYGR